LKIFKFLLLLICCQVCAGCGGTFWSDAVELFRPEGEPNDSVISYGYDATRLQQSSSADVLVWIYLPAYEKISQSSSVIASAGQKKKGYKSWLKMVAFDADELTARRKYLLIVDERPKFLFAEPWASLVFNCEMALALDVLDEPYSNENERRIAILKRVQENARKDVEQVRLDNSTVDVCGMLINQVLEAVLVRLESSPVLASELTEPEGLSFEHINLDKGKIRAVFDGEMANVQIKLGSVLKKRVEWTGRSFKYRRADK